ncbi:TRAP transporter small permease [Bosea sp. NPDC055594]|jgi:TRAP-type C4-dicarboxylate transport system permease small subunit
MPMRATLLRLTENLLIAGFVVMIAMVFGNVVLRYGFNSGIIMSEEVSRMIFVWLTFGGAFLVAKDGQHLGMTTVVNMLGRNGRWWCRLAVEGLSLLCMTLLILGCWQQAVINLDNHAPVTGVPIAVVYFAGLAGGIGIAALNLTALARLLSGRMPDDELVIGAESEELSAFEAQQAEEKRR